MNPDAPDYIRLALTRYRDGGFSREHGLVTVEAPLTFVVNGLEMATLMCTPTHLKAFTYGFLFTSNMITSARDVLSWDLDQESWQVTVSIKESPDPDQMGHRVYTSGCGKGVLYANVISRADRRPVTTPARIHASTIIKSMDWLAGCSDLHKKTGGVHSASVSIDNRLPEYYIDDIGRHNTVDKIIGTLMLADTPTENLAIISTGRISSEILHKAHRFSIAVVASRGAPTHKGVLLAQEMGMTVVGFVRGDAFSIFTHPERIILP